VGLILLHLVRPSFSHFLLPFFSRETKILLLESFFPWLLGSLRSPPTMNDTVKQMPACVAVVSETKLSNFSLLSLDFLAQ